MMKLLAEKGADVELEKILVEVHTFREDAVPGGKDEERFAKDLFVEINKAEPVKLVDMPGVAKESDRNVLTMAADKLKEKYPDMFSTSQNCRKPNLNIDNLRDQLFASDAIKKHSLTTSNKLFNWMMERNEELAAKYRDQKSVDGVTNVALKKAQKFDFYLGLEPNWLYV